MMNLSKLSMILPIVMAVEALGAGIIYSFAKQWGTAMYWYCACAITIAVLLIPRYG
jgi:hypothetical protein